MQIPLEISYRDVTKTETLENLIREKAKKLEQFCDSITGCRIAVERPHNYVKTGNQYRIRLSITVPPGREIVISKEPGKNDMHDSLPTVIRDAFSAARKQLQKVIEINRRETKKHPEQEVRAIISKVYPEEGYGFLRTINGREIYFHKNSLLNEDIDNLKEGRGVRFFEQEGEKGPQASTVQVIN
ncbi:MAG TPA: HPF/RaiA family ribosome-associated protein [Ignavibacteriaceae bacterium]|nr:HPF/RaiA family ribosome-associated protein [Ignavibacteriaceae bacterium]